MKRFSRFSAIASCALLFTAILALVSCEYKDLCYNHPHLVNVRVQFDWSLAPDAQPDGMTVLFYDMDNPSAYPVRFDFRGREGGTVQVNAGTYRVLSFNYDTKSILFRGIETIGTYEGYTRQSTLSEGTQMSGSLPVDGTKNESVILSPDMLWAATSKPLTVEQRASVDYNDVQEGSGVTDQIDYTVVLRPEQRIRIITVTARNKSDLVWSNRYSGAISTLTSSVFLETGKQGMDEVTQAFPLTMINDSTLQTDFYVFGHCPDGNVEAADTHRLTIYGVQEDGKKWYSILDVTAQMHDPVKNPDPFHIYVTVDSLPVPKYIPGEHESGMEGSIDSWQPVDIPIGM
jgi:hypothetical protein